MQTASTSCHSVCCPVLCACRPAHVLQHSPVTRAVATTPADLVHKGAGQPGSHRHEGQRVLRQVQPRLAPPGGPFIRTHLVGGAQFLAKIFRETTDRCSSCGTLVQLLGQFSRRSESMLNIGSLCACCRSPSGQRTTACMCMTCGARTPPYTSSLVHTSMYLLNTL